MDYLQTLFGFFNAPLFATFLLALFWKRMTPAAGGIGLIAGTVAAVGVDTLNRMGVLNFSGQGAAFLAAIAAFVVDIVLSIAVTLVTRPKPDSELTGLVWSLTPRRSRQHSESGEDSGWYRKPVVLGPARSC